MDVWMNVRIQVENVFLPEQMTDVFSQIQYQTEIIWKHLLLSRAVVHG